MSSSKQARQRQQKQSQAVPPPMPGYERDINQLIDAFSLLAHDQQVLSFPAFKQFFQQGCYAYIHQAYWGCEHSSEYAQLLFAVALDRLDVPSPTAPQDSPLWHLHQLVPKGGGGNSSRGAAAAYTAHPAAAADPGGGGQAMELDPGSMLHQQDQQVPGLPLGADAADAFSLQQPQQVDVLPPPPLPQQPQLQPQQQQRVETAGAGPPPQSPLPQHNTSPQQHDAAMDVDPVEQQQQPAPLQQSPPQQQQMVDEPFSSDWVVGSPLLGPQQQQGQGDAPIPDDLLQLMSTPLQQQHQQAQAAAGGGIQGVDDGFMLPDPAIPAGQLDSQQQQQHPQHPQPQQQQQQQQQEELQLLPSQQQQEEDEFLSDLLAILDEGTQGGQEQQQSQAAAAGAGDEQALPAGVAAHQQQQQPQQRLMLQVPMCVKGAVVFTLLALHESQLNYPKVPIYVPLPLLQQLGQAAAEFRAAGPAVAGDALKALHVLTSQHRLLVGQFRRPNHWEPQLPASLMPGGRLPYGLGLNTAVGAAARKAAKSSLQSAAVAAAARAARVPLDPGVHREALFHIKTALRGLSNFGSLQTLCDEYAAARRAIFDPLLGGSAQAPSVQEEQPQEHHAAGDGAVTADQPEGPTALVVQRGGSRRKRQAAVAAASAPAAAGGAASAGTDGARQASAAAAGGGGGDGSSSQQATANGGGVGAQPAQGKGLDLPEMFDTSFANSLQGLANSEASRMLLLLDPCYNANKVRKRTAEERRAAKAAQAAATAEAREKLDRFKKLTMARAGEGGPQAAPATGGQRRKQQQQQQSSQPSAAAAPQSAPHSYGQELVAAGVVSEADLQEGPDGLADLSELRGGAQQVMRHVAQQRQANMQVAEQWLRAESALLVVDDGGKGADEDEDMP